MMRPLLGALLSLFVASVAAAQATLTLSVTEGQGQLVELPQSASSVFVGDPAVASVQAVSDTTLYVAGVALGSTNVFALDFGEQLIVEYRVRVLQNNEAAAPGLGAGARIAGAGNTAVITGQARSVEEALAALEAQRRLQGLGRDAVNQTTLHGGTQVSLRVRFVEASRNDLVQLGFDLSALGGGANSPLRIVTGTGIASDFLSGGVGLGADAVRAGIGGQIDGTDVDVVLRALERRGIVQILSEPTLTTTSGRRANFRAGGEFAFPVNQGDGVITAGFKEFGVSIDFLPVVLPNNRLAIEVEPEVSFIDPDVGVQIEGFAAPSLSVRRASTTVEVGSGQTFAIAGLYEQFSSDANSGIPGTTRSPILGTLFGTREQRREERELVIFITPYLAEAADAAEANRRQAVSVADTLGFIVK